MMVKRSLVGLCMLLGLVQAHASNMDKIEKNLSDAMITTTIRTKFIKNEHLNPLKISVSTQHGVVTLVGHAQNNTDYVSALRIVTHTRGVRAINASEFDIDHRTSSAVKDAYLTAKIQAAILQAKVLDDESIPLVGIQVTTENGIVTLNGYVRKERSITFILKRINRVYGVKKIISNLHATRLN